MKTNTSSHRTYRISNGLLERFDKAVKFDGVDRTTIIINAIRNYVEAHEKDRLQRMSFEKLANETGEAVLTELGEKHLLEMKNLNMIEQGVFNENEILESDWYKVLRDNMFHPDNEGEFWVYRKIGE